MHVDCADIRNNKNFSIVSQLFKNNQQLCQDLAKTEQQLPLNQFLEKYNCQNKCLPTINC